VARRSRAGVETGFASQSEAGLRAIRPLRGRHRSVTASPALHPLIPEHPDICGSGDVARLPIAATRTSNARSILQFVNDWTAFEYAKNATPSTNSPQHAR
jgi:hypothetical protein